MMSLQRGFTVLAELFSFCFEYKNTNTGGYILPLHRLTCYPTAVRQVPSIDHLNLKQQTTTTKTIGCKTFAKIYEI